MDVAMNNNYHQLNRTTKSLKRLFPALSALLVFTPLIISAETTISGSTDKAQLFSSDSEYIINEGVTITPDTSDPSVTISDSIVRSVTNNGEVTGASDGLYITTDGQTLQVVNQEKAIIRSTGANGITVIDMGGEIKNAGTIAGAEYGIKIHEDSGSFNVANAKTGTIEGKTAISADAGFTLTNAGTFTGTTDNGVELQKAGKSKIENNGTIEDTENGIIAYADNRLQQIQADPIKGSASAARCNSN